MILILSLNSTLTPGGPLRLSDFKEESSRHSLNSKRKRFKNFQSNFKQKTPQPLSLKEKILKDD